MNICPRCKAEVTPGDRFCADCGARIAAPDPVAVGGRSETVGPGLAGATDPGLSHYENQDAFVLSGPPGGGNGTIMIVCDGVSNSQTPALASAKAARVAHDALSGALADSLAVAPYGALVVRRDGREVRERAMRDAIRRAHDAVCALPFDRQSRIDPPAATIVAAWLHASGATVGWLGDSRAYCLDDTGGRLLTRDHSWLAMALECGEMTEAQARRDKRSHALVHCLGSTDFATATACPEPSCIETTTAGGWLLLCSDGLWNYAETTPAIARAAGQGRSDDAAALCARLIAFARSSGGADNVTAVVAACNDRRCGAKADPTESD